MEKEQVIPLSPHPFETKLEAHGGPNIMVSKEAYADMQSLIGLVEDEVSWMGEVERISGMCFLIKKIFLVNQVVNPVHTTMNKKNIADLMVDIIKREGVQAANKIVFWGHSHVGMDVEPSGEDENQMELFSASKPDFFIRGIGNKLGKIKFSVFFFKLGIALHDVPWMVEIQHDATDAGKWKQEIKNKVKKERGWRNLGALGNSFGTSSIPLRRELEEEDFSVMPAQSRSERMRSGMGMGYGGGAY